MHADSILSSGLFHLRIIFFFLGYLKIQELSILWQSSHKELGMTFTECFDTVESPSIQ